MDTRQASAHRAAEGADLCPACLATLGAEERCGNCGAARAPGGYLVRRLVAQTPHSRLYLAEDEAGRPVALKELLFALVPDAKQLEAFEREAALLAQLSHPMIPRFHRAFREGSGVHTRLYLAQEFVEGASLLQAAERQRLSVEEAKDVARQVLRVLDHLHTRQPPVLHRDVKPANLIRRPSGELALVDFGSARDLARGATHGSTLVGTFGYMPPEQLGGTVDATSDLYALGATLVHLLSGKAPADLFRPGTMSLEFRPVVEAPPAFLDWLGRLLAPSPADRFRSAKAALAALDAPAPVAAAPRPTRNPAALAALLGAAMAVCAGATSFLLLRSPPPSVAGPAMPAPPVLVAPVRPAQPPAPAERPYYGGKLPDPVKLERVAQPARPALDPHKAIPLDLALPLPRAGHAPDQLRLAGLKLDLATQDADGRGSLTAEVALASEAPRTVRVTLVPLDAEGNDYQPSHADLRAPGLGAPAREALRFAVPVSTRRARLQIGDPWRPDAVVEVDLGSGRAELVKK